MRTEPLVSVVIPSYNREKLVLKAVKSVLGQSYTNYEILVAVDGSSDQTATLLASLDGPITVLNLPHTGQGAYPRNQAIKISQGELIAFLDDDDLWLENKLARQVDIFQMDPQIGLVYSDARFLFPDGQYSDPLLIPWQKKPERLFEGLLKTMYVHPSTVMVRRVLFDRIGTFEEKFSSQSNYLFWLRASHRNPSGYVDEVLTLVRKHIDSRSNKENQAQFEHLVSIFTHFYRTERLSLKARFLVRRTISRAHTHIGLALNDQDEKKAARRRFMLSLAWNPLQRCAWLAFLGTL